jgi:hypothetical protein
MGGFFEVGAGRTTVGLLSRSLFAFDMQHAPLWERSTGKLVARSGHRGSWSRGTTLAGLNASVGTYTAANTVPGYDVKSVLGVSRLLLTMGTSDTLTFPIGWAPQMLSGWLRFVETGARTTLNATLFSIAQDDPTAGVRFFLDTSGSFYRLTYHNGTTSVTATLASGAPTAGQTVDLRWQWAANGSVSLWQSINGAGETTASSGALALPSAWSASSLLRLNRRGISANPGQGSYRACTVLPGLVAAAELMGAW